MLRRVSSGNTATPQAVPRACRRARARRTIRAACASVAPISSRCHKSLETSAFEAQIEMKSAVLANGDAVLCRGGRLLPGNSA